MVSAQRSLAVVLTGEQVFRSQVQRGAVLTEGPYAEVSTNPQVIEAYMGTAEAAHG